MLWYASKLKIDQKKLILVATLTAKLVVHLMKDERSINALEVYERYCHGNATKKEFEIAKRNAANAANAYAANNDYDAAYAACNAAAYAAYAAYATYATYAAYNAAAYAAYATYNAYDAAYYADVNVAYDDEEIFKKSADICREILTNEIF